MKARLIRDAETLNPEWDAKAAGAAREAGKPYDIPHSLPAPKGTEIEHPDAWRLVVMGYAEPVDQECEIRAGLTSEQVAAIAKGVDRMEKEFDKTLAKAKAKAAK